MILELRERLVASLRRLPTRADVRALVIEVLWLAPILAVTVVASPVMEWAPEFDTGTVKLALVAVLVPALGEELLFRVALLPAPRSTSDFPWLTASAGLATFVAWHPLQAILFGGIRAAIFLDPWFLVAVAALGIGCVRLYWKTGSVWPPVILHWLVVVGWKALAGGPPLV